MALPREVSLTLSQRDELEAHLRRRNLPASVAQRSRVVWMVLREVVLLAAVGLAISVPIALAASKLVESFLFGMKPNDPLALIGSAVTLVTAAILAGYVPARNASRIDPMIALRHE